MYYYIINYGFYIRLDTDISKPGTFLAVKKNASLQESVLDLSPMGIMTFSFICCHHAHTVVLLFRWCMIFQQQIQLALATVTYYVKKLISSFLLSHIIHYPLVKLYSYNAEQFCSFSNSPRVASGLI
jgi:hypothetical protein